METITLLALLDRPIAVHPVFIKLAGSHTAGVMLSQAWYWTRVMQKKRGERFDGWFYKSQEEWEEETLLKRREWENARKLLRATGFWQENRRDSPARLYYRIDLEAFALALAGEGAVRTRTDDPCDLESDGEGTDRANKIAPSVRTPRAPLSNQTETTPPALAREGLVKIPPPDSSNADPNKRSREYLLDFLQDKIGPIPSRSAESKALDWLLESGYSNDDCKRCWEYLFSQQWRGEAVTWGTVKKQIGGWKAKGAPKEHSNGFNGAAGNGQPRQKTQYEILKERGAIS